MSTSTPSAESNLQVDLLAWLELNKSRIAAALGISGIVVIGYLIFQWRSERRETAASYAVLASFTVPGNPAEDTGVSSASLLKLASEYGGTRAGERALLLGAGRLYAEGNYSEAKLKFDAFSQQYPESPFLSIALLGSATSLDALNQTTEALAAYQDLITILSRQDPGKALSTDPVASQAKLARARIYEALNQPEQAFVIYEEVSKGTGNRNGAQQAAVRREALVAKFPDLVKTAVLTNTVNVTAGPGNASFGCPDE